MQQIVIQCFTEQTKVECDGYRSCRKLENVTFHYNPYEAGDLDLFRTTISNFKVFLLRIYCSRCVHLQSYMDEFYLRFNRRNARNQSFVRFTRAITISFALLR